MTTNFRRILLLALAIGGVLVLLYAPTLGLLGRAWWNDPDYSHGLLVPFVAALMVWAGRDRLRTETVSPARGAGGLSIAFALLLLFVGVRGPIYLAQYASFGLMLVGVTLYTGGYGFLNLLLAPLALLALAIPLPTVVLSKIAAPLQLFASQCAVMGMQAFDIPLVREGNVIEMMPYGALKPHKLEVVQACSGVRSLMSLLTMAFMLAFFTRPRMKKPLPGGRRVWWRQYGVWRSVLLVAAAIPIAVLTNALRVSGTGVLSHYYGIEVAQGFFHSFSGAITYTVAAALLLAAGWLMDRAHGGGKGRGTRQSPPKLKGVEQRHEPASAA